MVVKKNAAPTRYKGVNMEKVKKYSVPRRFADSGWLPIYGKDAKGKYNDEPVLLRLLPPMGDMDLPWVEHHIHYADGRYGSQRFFQKAGEDFGFGLTCLAQHTGEPCPACELQEWAEQNDQGELAEQLRCNVRFYCNVVFREDGKIYSWGAPSGVITQVVAFLNNPKIGDFTHPTTGRDLIVQKQTANRGRFNVQYDPDRSPILTPDGGGEKWEEARDLTKAIKLWSRDDMIQILVENLQAQAPVGKVFGVTSSHKTAGRKHK